MFKSKKSNPGPVGAGGFAGDPAAAPVGLGQDVAAALSGGLRLIDNVTIEIVPMKGVEAAIDALPTNAAVSVTCSPVKGLAETQRLTEVVLAKGHRPVPHLSARLVRDEAHARELATWCRGLGLSKLFLIAGDPPEHGAYAGVTEFLNDFLGLDHGLSSIGVAAYPDGHPLLSARQLTDALHTKEAMLAEAGLDSWCSTQMCFDPGLILSWLQQERASGLAQPVHLGVCGVIAKTKLLKLAVRLGVGQSLSYLRKNRSAATSMLTSTNYDPGALIDHIGPHAHDLNITGVHAFTFNQVAATEEWRAFYGTVRSTS